MFIVTLWGLRCVDEYVRATVWDRRCEKDVVRKTLWERRCEKDVVRMTLWKRRCRTVVVKNIFLFICFFNRQIIVIKNVLHRLGALHLWCLCLYSRRRRREVKLHNQAGLGGYFPRGGFNGFSQFTLIKSYKQTPQMRPCPDAMNLVWHVHHSNIKSYWH